MTANSAELLCDKDATCQFYECHGHTYTPFTHNLKTAWFIYTSHDTEESFMEGNKKITPTRRQTYDRERERERERELRKIDLSNYNLA